MNRHSTAVITASVSALAVVAAHGFSQSKQETIDEGKVSDILSKLDKSDDHIYSKSLLSMLAEDGEVSEINIDEVFASSSLPDADGRMVPMVDFQLGNATNSSICNTCNACHADCHSSRSWR